MVQSAHAAQPRDRHRAQVGRDLIPPQLVEFCLIYRLMRDVESGQALELASDVARVSHSIAALALDLRRVGALQAFCGPSRSGRRRPNPASSTAISTAAWGANAGTVAKHSSPCFMRLRRCTRAPRHCASGFRSVPPQRGSGGKMVRQVATWLADEAAVPGLVGVIVVLIASLFQYKSQFSVSDHVAIAS